MATIPLHDILAEFRDEDVHRLGCGHAVVPTCWQVARCLATPWMKNPSARDVLCAEVSKKNNLGRLRGFDDFKQGYLFFSIADNWQCEASNPPKRFLFLSANSGSLSACS
jgi:hypothetical protein